MKQYEKAKEHILKRLRTELPQNLFYHGLPHTLEVLKAVVAISKKELIHDECDLTLLKTAALFHDTGYILQYKANEPIGCEIARQTLPKFEYSGVEINTICEMIMATVIPQNPKDQLGMILCDADLDYLGRDDFYSISEKLRKELAAHEMTFSENEWLRFEISFIEKHEYFTNTTKALRNPLKNQHLNELKNMLK